MADIPASDPLADSRRAPGNLYTRQIFAIFAERNQNTKPDHHGFSRIGQTALRVPTIQRPEGRTGKVATDSRSGSSGPDGCEPPAAAVGGRAVEGGAEKLTHCTRDFGAPLAIIVCADTDEVWTRKYDGKKIGDIDATIITDHMMLCAASLGLDTLWICMFKPEAVSEEFHLPANVEPVNILLVGYGAGEPSSPDRHDTLRKPLSETVFEESF